MSDMENPQNDKSLLDWIKFISTNRVTGRLGITGAATRGYLVFNDGRLGAARLGLLTGFRAVNAAVSLRGVQFSFDHSSSASTETAFTPHERLVLKQFFGIETVELPESADSVGASEVDCDLTPSQVVPLSDVQGLSGNDLENTSPLDVEPVVPIVRDNAEDEIPAESMGLSGSEFPTLASQSFFDTEPAIYSLAKDPANVGREATLVKSKLRKFKAQKNATNPGLPSFPWRPQIALYLILLFALTAGAIALIPKVRVRRQSASVANKIQDPSLPMSPPQSTELPSESLPVSERESKELASESPSLNVSQSQSTGVRGESPPVSVPQQRNQTEHNDQTENLTGQWMVVNTVEKTNYRAFGNLEIGFRLTINQTGREFTAKGEKISESGRSLPASDRTLIHLTGSIDGDKVEATFVEHGSVRRTKGRFVWRVENAGSGLAGTFVSTAARSSGKSAAIKEL